MERRLSAILAADVVGYSRLVGNDEIGTLSALKAHRTELIEESVARHLGRIFKLTGDGILVEFPSIVSALTCAREIQSGMRLRNVGAAADHRLDFRIGINLGDILVEDGDIFGDGVNVATRIEGVARPGGIAISGTVRDHVGNRTDATFEDAGDMTLKNIERPVRVFHVVETPLAIRAASETSTTGNKQSSIAVLPFDNMSGDPEQEYFSDGITEDIITDLSKLAGLRVIARNSVFTYKNKAVDVQEVSRRFDVAAVLEGSVRKAGARVRITAQLIDGRDGSHLWAERYDRDLTDIFEIQDEIARKIVEQLKVRLMPHEKGTLVQKPTTDLVAYDLYLQGRKSLHMRTHQSLRMARFLFSQAVEHDPLFARAFAGIADCDVYLRSWHGEDVLVATILGVCGYALHLDESLAEAHTAQGYALFFAGRPDEAAVAFERALAIDPDSHEVCLAVARFSFARGAYERAEELFRRSVTLHPDDFRSPNLLRKALSALGRTAEAKAVAHIIVDRAGTKLDEDKNNPAPLQVGACGLAALGVSDRAREWIERALALDPDDHNTKFNAACTYALLGESDKAAQFLSDYLRPLGSDESDWCRLDPDLATLRDHPVHAKILVAAPQE
ncbi:tetratricopeptide repeat protein [Mesorhizobium sp. IMUNJ 23033]|uniref:tetratricopeptide repeat protein n=1 Tax=Mesorhizobium sp. IMUNJ 23033 TaxID=3378039 RepID=UPI00384C11FB